MANKLQKVKMRNRAKFCDNRSKHYRDIAIFANIKMTAFCNLGFLKIQNVNGRHV